MCYETDGLIIGAIVGLVIGAMISGIIGAVNINEIGNMVCDENDLGAFIKFKNNKIHCEPLEKEIPYDGGWIVVQDKRRP